MNEITTETEQKQYAYSTRYRTVAVIYEELAISSPAAAVAIASVVIAPNRGGMARLSWPRWLANSMLTGLDVE